MIKTNDPEYRRIHQWMIHHYGKATKCENPDCAATAPKRFEWALIHGREYAKDRNVFTMLCASCHRKYDFTDNQRLLMSRARKKKHADGELFTKEYRDNLSTAMKGVNAIPVVKISKDGRHEERFSGVREAASITGISQPAISNCLTGRSKSAGGFIWQYAQMN